MATEAQVWQALSEVADPEIPVVSLVDLGVVRDVRVEHDRVHVGFTPTFLGCPALEVMRDELAAKVIELGAEPDIEVIRDDSWSTDRITPEGREKLRAAGFAPPAPRSTGETTLLQLQTGTFRCPLLRLDRHEAREHLRAHPLPLDPLLQLVSTAVRAVQDPVMRTAPVSTRPCSCHDAGRRGLRKRELCFVDADCCRVATAGDRYLQGDRSARIRAVRVPVAEAQILPFTAEVIPLWKQEEEEIRALVPPSQLATRAEELADALSEVNVALLEIHIATQRNDGLRRYSRSSAAPPPRVA